MRVEKIGYFVEVARAGSLRAAALRLGIAQSSLGDQITALEEELNVVLIERTRRGVRLTASGSELLPHAIALIDAQRELVDAAAATSGTLAGTVRIGATPMITASSVIPVVAELRRTHRNLQVSIKEGSSTELERHLQTGAIDFAMITTPATPQPQGVTRRHVSSWPLAAYVPHGHPLSSEATVDWTILAGFDLITMGEGTTLWHVMHARIATPRVVAETDSMHNLRLMVEAGIGVGIGVGDLRPPPAGSARAATATWIPIDGESRGLSTHVSVRAGSPLPRTARLVRDAMVEYESSDRGIES